ncbi:MAG TPA: cobalamin-binding protein, partial [bacterium]|nr:cobalamin-binding protein [bacterium]
RQEAVRRFLSDARQLAAGGQLDVLSIGTSQLSQSRFGEDWGTSVNGGGVPLAFRDELAAAWRAARPMLVRSYAGTRDLAGMARLNDETIHNAWHALSIWWFCRIDGRGPYSLRENLRQMAEALQYIGASGKPFEPNVPHHFAFRGGDEAAYVVSGYLAARLAKSHGIRQLIIQNMLTTPKYTWGVQDLARSRTLLRLVRELEDDHFHALLQTRAGLDYLSADPARAKAQLAAVTALMDDIEPRDASSPHIIHVVSWTEATRLADPAVIAESVRICRQALTDYRRLRARGDVPDMGASQEVEVRARELEVECRAIIRAIEKAIPGAFSPEGLYRIFAAGFLPVPYLWECRDELPGAVSWRTRLVRGAVRLVDEAGVPLSTEQRIDGARANLEALAA